MSNDWESGEASEASLRAGDRAHDGKRSRPSVLVRVLSSFITVTVWSVVVAVFLMLALGTVIALPVFLPILILFVIIVAGVAVGIRAAGK